MSYFVLCTFDLFNASSKDYDDAYTELAKLGLHTALKADNGNNIELPNTTAAGLFTGTTTTSVRDDVTSKVQSAFKALGLNSKIFVVVGNNYAWGQRET